MQKKSNIFINTLVLLLVTFVTVTALAVVNQITIDPIKQAEIKARADAYKVVYNDAADFGDIDNLDKLIEESTAYIESEGHAGCTIDDALAAKDADGNVIGYVISATTPSGYGGNVQIAIGISLNDRITGFDVVSHSETPGFGAKCTEDEFKSQFKGKSATTLSFTKDGAKTDTEFDAVSGATITSTAIENVVNTATLFYNNALKGE